MEAAGGGDVGGGEEGAVGVMERGGRWGGGVVLWRWRGRVEIEDGDVGAMGEEEDGARETEAAAAATDYEGPVRDLHFE